MIENKNLKTSQKGLSLIKKWEGCRLRAYVCPAGKLTIGYGHTGPDVKRGMMISQTRAEELLVSDVQRFENSIKALVTVPLKQHQFDALVSFAYNVGSGNLGSSTLLRLLNKGMYSAVPLQLRRWVYGNNRQKLQGLVNRREDEVKMWEGR